MRVHQHLEPAAVGGHVTAESPALAQCRGQQPGIDVCRDAVDLVVGSHQAAHVRVLHRHAKRHEEILADDPRRIVARRGVGAPFRLAVHGEMLSGREHVMAIEDVIRALQAVDGGRAHL
jgi:hypothetical protein